MDAKRLLARLSQVFVAAALTFSSAAAAIPASAAPRSTTVEIARYPYQDDPDPNDLLDTWFSPYNKGYRAGYETGFRRGYEVGCRKGPVQAPGPPHDRGAYARGFSHGYVMGFFDGWGKIRVLCNVLKTHPLPPIER